MIECTNENAARYAIIFAADAGTEALYAYEMGPAHERDTDEVVNLATQIGNIAEARRKDAVAANADFYPVAFVEQAAMLLCSQPLASIKALCDAGQAESDSIATRPLYPRPTTV